MTRNFSGRLWMATFLWGLWTTATTATYVSAASRAQLDPLACFQVVRTTTSTSPLIRGQHRRSCRPLLLHHAPAESIRPISQSWWSAVRAKKPFLSSRPDLLLAQSKDSSTDGSDLDNDVVSIAWLDDMDDEDDYDDDEDYDDDDTEESETPKTNKAADDKPPAKWDLLPPNIRQRIQRAGQELAVANKKKREPETDKKRRT
jgi:hypothetical protein